MRASDATTPTNLMDLRYQQLEPLGTGGMGTVYKAFDRLRNQHVALKRVSLAAQDSLLQSLNSRVSIAAIGTPKSIQAADAGSQAESQAGSQSQDVAASRHALINEFRTLASMRHPNVISVLDYGFDRDQQSYFTMELLADAKTIIDAGKKQPLDYQISLLIQVLQALAYLHRRGILHRDLKPANVLVVEGSVKVLDFGLSSETGADTGISGTLAYMAPELLRGAAASVSSDLYTVGVIAYEMIVGAHPFAIEGQDINELIVRTLTLDPELNTGRLPPLVPSVLRRLLNKQPANRYVSATDAIEAFNDLLAAPITVETQAIRDSYLQTAPLVGRKTELALLAKALTQTKHHQGGFFLVGGESGVGKSRVMNELRTEALVKGVLTVTGQAVDSGGAPYQLWRDVLPTLALAGNLTALDLGVLAAISPLMTTVFDLAVVPIPDLAMGIARTRLFATLMDLIRRQPVPVLIVLEDLHWADESSLELLQWIVARLQGSPVMIVGTFRDDEVPLLPQQFPEGTLLRLPRLQVDEIATLSAAMLGESGQDPNVVDLLQRETEGNVFFLIEVVRALAESSGQLANVGMLTLPAHVLTGGVQRIIQRRLEHLPIEEWAPLRLAAVFGRSLDLLIMIQAFPDLDLLGWLTQASNAAIIEIVEDKYRFAHDKLREGVLASLSESEQVTLHHEVGLALERAYKRELKSHYAELAFHFERAGQTNKALQYLHQAARQALARYDHGAVLGLVNRALELAPERNYLLRIELLFMREVGNEVRGQRAAQREDLDTIEAVIGQLFRQTHPDQHASVLRAVKTHQLELWLRRGKYFTEIGEYQKTQDVVKQALDLAQVFGLRDKQAQAFNVSGKAYMRTGVYVSAIEHLNQALIAATETNQQALLPDILRNLGNIYLDYADYPKARDFYLRSQQTAEEIGDRLSLYRALNNLGETDRLTGRYIEAINKYETAHRFTLEFGERATACMLIGNIGLVARYLGDFQYALECCRRSLQLSREITEPYSMGWALLGCGYIYDELGDLAAARQYIEEAIANARETHRRDGEGWALVALAQVHHHAGDYERAAVVATSAASLAAEINLRSVQAQGHAVSGYAFAQLKQFDEAILALELAVQIRSELEEQALRREALVGLATVYQQTGATENAIRVVNELLTDLNPRSFDGANDVMLCYLMLYRVVKQLSSKVQPADIERVLRAGYAAMQQRLTHLTSLEMDQVFQSFAPAYHTFEQLWRDARLSE